MFVFSINSLRWVLTMPANAVSAMPSASNTMLTVYMMHVLLDLQQPAMVTSVGVFSVTHTTKCGEALDHGGQRGGRPDPRHVR